MNIFNNSPETSHSMVGQQWRLRERRTNGHVSLFIHLSTYSCRSDKEKFSFYLLTMSDTILENQQNTAEKNNENEPLSSTNGNDTEKNSTNEPIEQQQMDSTNGKQKPDLSTLPTRAYLDQTVVPVLLQGMSQLARDRPAKPIESLALYLQQNKEKYGE